ncbi:MAG: hypothetical protein OXD45_03295 [Rhodobacteraceae bacterium]|nr:hypothetical protein [Paracoccaceae bacterium]
MFESLRVMDGKFINCDVLIGMDIIGAGDFARSNMNNETLLTFQFPPAHQIGFVHEIQVGQGKPGFRKPSQTKTRKKRKRRLK